VPAAASAAEFDIYNSNVTGNFLAMFGGQCLYSSGVWEIANETSGWQPTSISCTPLAVSGWHHIVLQMHLVGTTEYFDYLTIDGTTSAINQTLPTTVLPSGWTSHVGMQVQEDIGTVTTPQTFTEYIDNALFQASNGYITAPLDLTVNAVPTTFGNPVGRKQPWIR
jgi:hypothetical protein